MNTNQIKSYFSNLRYKIKVIFLTSITIMIIAVPLILKHDQIKNWPEGQSYKSVSKLHGCILIDRARLAGELVMPQCRQHYKLIFQYTKVASTHNLILHTPLYSLLLSVMVFGLILGSRKDEFHA